MRFRLLKFAAIAIFLRLGLPDLQAVPSTILSDKGGVFSLRSTSIQALDLREDGRYMFFSSGSNSFSTLDLLDMGRRSSVENAAGERTSEIETVGNVVGLFVESAGRLIVVTDEAIQYFDISKPLKPEEFESERWTRSEDESELSPVDACYAGSKKVAILEQRSSGTQHRLRIVTQRTSVLSSEGAWASAFINVPNGSQDIDPFAVRCAGSTVIIFGMDGSLGSTNDIFVSKATAESPGSMSQMERVFKSDYTLVDFLLTEKKDELAFLFNRDTAVGNSDDSQIISVPVSSLSQRTTISVGQNARLLATYKETGNVFGNAVYVGIDHLGSSGSVNKLLFKNSAFSSGSFEIDRGDGSTTVGSGSMPSRWYSTANDHYKFGLTESTGLALLGRGPKITVDPEPPEGRITSSAPLTFSFSADRAIHYEIRHDPNWTTDGEAAGFRLDVGNLVRSGSLAAGEVEDISISPDELGIKVEGYDVAYLMAWDQSLQRPDAPKARVGIRFDYNPPPGALRDFKLKDGDSSIHVCFKPPAGGDIEGYVIRFSYSSDDITTDRTFESGIPGYTLTSPASILAWNFRGCHVIHPVLNEVPVYVQAYAYDSDGQPGTVTDIQSHTAYRTLTLPEAFGSAESCALNGSGTADPSNYYLGLLCLILGLSIRLRRQN